MKATFYDILRYYIPHLCKYKWYVFFGAASYVIAGVIANALLPLIYKRIIDITTTQGTSNETIHQLWVVLTLLVLATIVYNLFFRVADFIHTYAQSNILKHLADEVFIRTSNHSVAFFSNTFVGSLVAKSQRYIRSFETLHDAFVFNILMNVATLVVMIGTLLYISPILAGTFLLWLFLYVLLTVWFLKRKIPKDIIHAAAQSKTTGVIADVLTNILTIKMFTNKIREERMFKSITKIQEEKRRETQNWDNWHRLWKSIAVAILDLTVMIIVVILWVKGQVTTGTIVLVQVYLFGLAEITWGLGRQISRIVQALNDAREMVDVFIEPLSVQDPISPEKVKIHDGSIEFNKVGFIYDDGNTIFKNLSFTIPAGQKVGLVGHSGAGKTTITKLLLRFADVTSGFITIDGQNIVAITQDDLRSNISYVPQDPILFHRSLKENIAYGKPNATEKEIICASKLSHAHEFIKSLPQGYKTMVGERGIKLSGGERQRVAIARALLKDVPVLVLDEATSSLDSISERYIQDALKTLMEGRTTIVVAHRLSTIRNMDRILVFSEGRIIEDGKHDDLIHKKDGTYRELWEEQSGGFTKE